MRNIKHILSSIWLLFLLTLYSPNSHPASVASNGGFENGVLEPWYQGAGTIDFPHDEFWNTSTDRSFTGSYSVTNIGNNELRQDFSPVATNQITEISFYLLMESFADSPAVQLHYGDGTFDQVTVSVGDTNIWQYMNITGSLDINNQLTGISFFGIRSGDSGGNRLYLDDVNVIATPLPPSLFLFISALLPFFTYGCRASKKN